MGAWAEQLPFAESSDVVGLDRPSEPGDWTRSIHPATTDDEGGDRLGLGPGCAAGPGAGYLPSRSGCPHLQWMRSWLYGIWSMIRWGQGGGWYADGWLFEPLG